jgi:uncharacterized protein (TIGR02646 family)
MISLNLNINPEDVVPDSAKYNQEVLSSLQKISDLVPDHGEGVFTRRLWAYYKRTLWEQQGEKCAFCEKEIVMDDGHVEHFRPKSEVRNNENVFISKEAYWWLAYDHKNYMVACAICNNQKGNRFPISNEGDRVTAIEIGAATLLTDEGILGEEQPVLINPRYKDPEPHLVYSYTPNQITPLVHIKETEGDDTGKVTIDILDLNRIRKNKKIVKDNLPGKRGSVLLRFKNEIKKYEGHKEKISTFRSAYIRMASPDVGLKGEIDQLQTEANKQKDVIYAHYLSDKSEFSGMCRFWLKNETELQDDFLNH